MCTAGVLEMMRHVSEREDCNGESHHSLIENKLIYIELIDRKQAHNSQHESDCSKTSQVLVSGLPAHVNQRTCFYKPTDGDPLCFKTDRDSGNRKRRRNGPMNLAVNCGGTLRKQISNHEVDACQT